MPDIKNVIGHSRHFLKTELWRIDLSGLSRPKAVWVKILRIFSLTFREFHDNQLPLRSSALTFYSLLSMVPVLAVAFGIAKGFGFQKILEDRLKEDFTGHEVVMEQLMGAAQRLLDSTQGGLIAGIGIAVLFWTVMRLLSNIELSFNRIWGVHASRPPGRKFSDYLSIMMIGPLLLIISGGLSVFIKTQITLIIAKISLLGFISPLIFFLLKFMPLGVLWLLFSVVYILMPNTKVRYSSGLIGGILAGTAIQIAQWAYITFQIGVANYNAIYGSFAALPLFLLWLQISWTIVLFGAEVAFAHQNAEMFEFEEDEAKMSGHFRKLLALLLARHVIHRFALKEPPQTAVDIAKSLEIPIRMARNLLDDLVESGILSRVLSENNGEPAHQPALDIHQITVQDVIRAMETKGISEVPLANTTPEFSTLSKALKSFDDSLQKVPENKLLIEI
ncbi:MAG: YihY/virulence factor BrkB family protein [Proteobacteria bacterium]|nr:YihY/virulence factor BrkB family protein [Pseudomonadota bacterium]